MLKKLSPNIFSILLILIVPVLALWQVSFFANTMKWDMMDQFFPCRYFISDCLNHGIFPLWCPYINFGYPFAADPQSGLFYPFTWLVSFATGYNVYTIAAEYVVHIIIAGFSFFFFLRSFGLSKTTSVVFGIVYCLSGIFISNAQHLTWIISMAWMPLILRSFKNIFDDPNFAEAIKLALFFYLGLTGGYPGLFIIISYFFLFHTFFHFVILISKDQGIAFKKPFLFFSVSAILLLFLCSGYLYSFIESLPHIARGKPITLVEANNFPLSPRAMISVLFPFATTCSSFFMNTDISMTNVYCGFLLLPLLFISLVKTRAGSFEKGFLFFAVFCLLAALGKYFFVRSIIYKVLPGMNMIRHASIFRVFAVLGAVFFSAKGFEWLLNTMRVNEQISFIKKVFGVYFLFLLVVATYAFIKNAFHIFFLFPFSSVAIVSFNTTQNVFSHILLQIVIQLFLLSFIILVLCFKCIGAKSKTVLLGGIIVVDILVAVQMNLPATVISNVKPSDLQAKLNKMPKNFPLPALTPVDQFVHFSDGSTAPIWYNISFLKKIPAKDGFNSFYLQGVDDFYTSAEASSILKNPFVFANDSTTKFQIEKFNPCEMAVTYRAKNNPEITLLQSYYNGWKAFLNGKEIPHYQSHRNFISCNAVAGIHQIKFVYDKPIVRILFFFSAALLLLLIGVLVFTSKKNVFSS